MIGSSNVAKKSAINYGSPISLIMIEWIVRGTVLLIYLVTIGISVLSVWGCIHNCIDIHTLFLQVTQCMVTIALPISFYHTWDHLTNFHKPKLQSQVVRIAWMVPVFCCESYLSLHFVKQAMYFQAIRELYEAYVIHCFMRLILQYLDEGGGGQSVAKRLSSYPASMGIHKPPFCCLTPWQMGIEFVIKCKTGVFQYVVVRFLTTIVATILFTIGYYEEGKYSITKPFIWMIILNFCSQTWALYSLFLFFLCVHKELHNIKPFYKFLCIKLIIFVSWWQALIIGILIRIDKIPIYSNSEYNSQDNAVFYRCTLISFEMIIAAIAFLYAFPINEYYITSISIKLNTRKLKMGKGLVQMPMMTNPGLSSMLSVYPAPSGNRSALSNASTINKASFGNVGTGDSSSTTTGAGIGRWLDFWGTTPALTGRMDFTTGNLQEMPTGRSMETTISFDSLDGLLNTTYHEEGIMQAPEEEAAIHSAYPRTATAAIGNEGDATVLPGEHSSQLPIIVDSVPLRSVHTHYRYGKTTPSLIRREIAAATPTGFKSPLLSPGSHNQIRRTTASNLTGPGRALDVEFERQGGVNNFHRSARREEEIIDTASSCSEYSHDETVTDETISNTIHDVNAPFDLSALEQQVPPEHALLIRPTSVQSAWDHSDAKPQRSPPRIRSTGSKGHRRTDRTNTASPWFEALWLSTLPVDLHEDLGDLEAQLSELYTAVLPTAQFKRMIKSSNTSS